VSVLRRLLEHPLARGRDLDDPRTTELRRQIIATKPFLRDIYEDWYELLATAVGRSEGPVLEVGAGAGFARRRFSSLIATDVLVLPGIDLAADARALPFVAGSLAGMIMTNVFHHIPDVGRFLDEVSRCVKVGGKLAMIEPWVTPWSRFVYRHLHHEPFDERASQWTLAAGGPLSVANGALPWIVFERDQAVFRTRFPSLELVEVRPFMPVRYLLSGGMSLRAITPRWSSRFWKTLERLPPPTAARVAMFALVVVRRRA
jgi:hypothetical protein